MQIGIIGGGQLAFMLIQAAHKRGLKCIVLDPKADCSAVNICDDFICANYDDQVALDKLQQMVDIITYEFENVNVNCLTKLTKLIQTTKPLELSTSRYLEKKAAIKANLIPTKFAKVKDLDDIKTFIALNDYPCVVKTDRLGYDGHGQIVLHQPKDLVKLEQVLKVDCIIEKMVDIKFEFSIIAFRNSDGDITYLPSCINTHKNNILHTSVYHNDYKPSKEIYDQVNNYLTYHNLIGIITIEFFVNNDDQVIFNEMAPRPHNSGHYSIEACTFSQYDLHLKAILNEKFPDNQVKEAIMVNVLGQDYQKAITFIKNNHHSQIYFHDYLKKEKIINRKVGHITAVGSVAMDILKYNYLLGE